MMTTLATGVFLNAAMKQMVAALLAVAADHPAQPRCFQTASPARPRRHASQADITPAARSPRQSSTVQTSASTPLVKIPAVLHATADRATRARPSATCFPVSWATTISASGEPEGSIEEGS